MDAYDIMDIEMITKRSTGEERDQAIDTLENWVDEIDMYQKSLKVAEKRLKFQRAYCERRIAKLGRAAELREIKKTGIMMPNGSPITVRAAILGMLRKNEREMARNQYWMIRDRMDGENHLYYDSPLVGRKGWGVLMRKNFQVAYGKSRLRRVDQAARDRMFYKVVRVKKVVEDQMDDEMDHTRRNRNYLTLKAMNEMDCGAWPGDGDLMDDEDAAPVGINEGIQVAVEFENINAIED